VASRTVPVSGKAPYLCEVCGEEILHDVVRVDGGRIYHMRCFSQHLHAGKSDLRECPSCQTLGALWSWDHSQWKECTVCRGTGYLTREDAGTTRGRGPEPLAAC
jgi:hypothetical protein